MYGRRVAVAFGLALSIACSGSPASPTPTPVPAPAPAPNPSPTPTPPASFVTAAQLVDVLTGAAIAAATAVVGSITSGPSDATGHLDVASDTSSASPRFVTVTHPSFVNREIPMKIPGAAAVLSLIPTSFDLVAFDQMFRSAVLHRWTAAPPLRLQARVVQFTSTGANEAVGIDEVMTDEELALLADDLTWALPLLTGNQFATFDGVERQSIDMGDRMSVLNSGVITVARYQGLQAATGYWGYTRWQYTSAGVVTGGTLMLDRDFERSGSVYRRSLRAHELGHALGYTHVTARTSVMNSNARTEPNTFDREASLIAFRRPPGNQSPDRDPAASSANVQAAVPGRTVWHIGAGAGGACYPPSHAPGCDSVHTPSGGLCSRCAPLFSDWTRR